MKVTLFAFFKEKIVCSCIDGINKPLLSLFIFSLDSVVRVIIEITKLLLFKLFCIVSVVECSISPEDYEDDQETNFKQKDSIRSKYSKVTPGQIPHHVMILKPYNDEFPYRAFCGGSIITMQRVLSSASCYVTHQKRDKHDISSIRVVAGLLETTAKYPGSDDNGVQQWRSIEKIYTQKFFRHPDYDLAVLELNNEWKLTVNARMIPYATLNQDFDGVCSSIAVKPSGSWSTNKELYLQEMLIIARKQCENIMQYSCRLFYCALNKGHSLAYYEMEGSGLICRNTGDPEEIAVEEGILVGVSNTINVELPSHYTKVALFSEWVKDGCEKFRDEVLLVLISFVVIKFL